MSTQGQWEEQLVAEWKSLQGYFVETNVGLTVTKSGGLNEADILAVRIDGKTLIVEHIEVGNLGKSYSDNLKMILKKFDEKKKKSVKDFITVRINASSSFEWDYRCIYIYTWGSKIEDLRTATKMKRIELLYLSELINNEIQQAIQEWRERRIRSVTIKEKTPSRITLPRKYRLLTLLDNVGKNRV